MALLPESWEIKSASEICLPVWTILIAITEYGPEVAFVGLDEHFNNVWYRMPYDYETHCYTIQRMRETVCYYAPFKKPFSHPVMRRRDFCDADGNTIDARTILIADMKEQFQSRLEAQP